ncbi:MAG: DUF6067 family protein [Chloroflexota bacterium]|nr:DUF6067 family protein [Chloroflexota bacterium]
MRAAGLALVFSGALALLAACGGGGAPTPDIEDGETPSPTRRVSGDGNTVVWANDGGAKVTRDELRASSDPGGVRNSVWDGEKVTLFGAKNEVVAFNLILEAPDTAANDVTVSLGSLTRPDGASITTRAASGNDVFNFVGRNIELFYVRYLQIKGLSVDLAYADYDERHIPERLRRPWTGEGEGSGSWRDRPDHDKFYPDIAVPLELVSSFDIAEGENQSVWVDIYVPKDAQAGLHSGTVTVGEGGTITREIPVELTVRDFALPDLPSARTMVYFGHEDITKRYLGEDQLYPDRGTDAYNQVLAIIDRHFQVAHRHKISLIGDMNGYTPPDWMDDAWTARLGGELFTPDRGYDGVGVGVGNNVYSIGTYGSWPWLEGTQATQATQADMWANADEWVNWFDDQAFTTPTEYFLYLEDEPEAERYPDLQRWAEWINNNPGPGARLKSLITVSLPDAMTEIPDLDIVASFSESGITADWEDALETLRADPERRHFVYNGTRPATGSFATEDDGVALRMIPWAQHKLGIDRWFFWESTYYTNFHCYGYADPAAQTNVFQQAQTFGCYGDDDDSLGEAGRNYLNGDGVLFYPGTDKRYSDDSYGVQGPLASLRLKHWRRGIQDADYLAMAAEIDPQRVQEIVEKMVPTVLWEYGVSDPDDPTYVFTDISWSTDPDEWEAARAELADIIQGAQ